MNLAIAGRSAPLTPAPGNGNARQQAATLQQLSSALKQGDMDAAKQAYVEMARNAPEGKTWSPDSPFATLGKALRAGDVGAAQAAVHDMVHNATGRSPGVVPPPSTLPVPPVVCTSSTGGVAGGTLSVQA